MLVPKITHRAKVVSIWVVHATNGASIVGSIQDWYQETTRPLDNSGTVNVTKVNYVGSVK